MECRRSHPQLCITAIHPGTTDTALSKPFQANVRPGKLYTPDRSAARILKVVKLSGNNVNLIIQGLTRIRVERFISTEPFMKASVVPMDEIVEEGVELEALVRRACLFARMGKTLAVGMLPGGLRKLVEAPGASGREERVRAVVEELANGGRRVTAQAARGSPWWATRTRCSSADGSAGYPAGRPTRRKACAARFSGDISRHLVLPTPFSPVGLHDFQRPQ